MSPSQDFSALTRRFYDAAVDDTGWSGVVAELKQILNLSMVGLGWIELDQAASLGSTMLHSDCTPYYEELFVELGPQNPFLSKMAAAEAGDVFTDRHLMPRDSFTASTMFNDWFIPQGDHAGAVVKVDDVAPRSPGFLVMQRGVRHSAFDRRDEADLGAIAPPLIHALAIRRRLGESLLRRRSDAYDEMDIGFAVTDGTGRVLQCNTTADRYFGANLGLTLRQNRLRIDHPSTLPQLIANAASPSPGLTPGGDVVVMHGESGTPTFAISVAPVSDGPAFGLPVQHGALLLIQLLAARLPDDFERRVQRLFGLTAKEASLAAALSSGLSIKEAAAERFISLPTARTQLASIFRKTGTNQQSQTVSLLLRALPVTR